MSHWPRVPLQVNNAGVATQFPHNLTRDGVEATFQATVDGVRKLVLQVKGNMIHPYSVFATFASNPTLALGNTDRLCHVMFIQHLS